MKIVIYLDSHARSIRNIWLGCFCLSERVKSLTVDKWNMTLVATMLSADRIKKEGARIAIDKIKELGRYGDMKILYQMNGWALNKENFHWDFVVAHLSGNCDYVNIAGYHAKLENIDFEKPLEDQITVKRNLATFDVSLSSAKYVTGKLRELADYIEKNHKPIYGVRESKEK